MEYASEFRCQTEPTKFTVNFVWKIKGFSQVKANINSSIFGSPKDPKNKWYLEINPKLNAYPCNGECVHVLLHITTLPKWGEPVIGNATLSVLSNSGVVYNKVEKEIIYTSKSENYLEYSKFLARSFLLANAELLPNDELTLQCTVSYTLFDNKEQRPKRQNQANKPAEETDMQVSSDVGSLLLGDEEFTDFTLLVGGKEFKVHKSVLAVKSPVFKAMFLHDMKEKAQNSVKIDDLEPQVLWEMLTCIYTGKAPPKLKELGKELLVASDKYLIEPLKIMAEEALIEGLSIEGAADLLILANAHSAKILKENVTEFILSHLKEVKGTAGWNNLTKNAALLTALFNAM